jgi:hypothetical protein
MEIILLKVIIIIFAMITGGFITLSFVCLLILEKKKSIECAEYATISFIIMLLFIIYTYNIN